MITSACSECGANAGEGARFCSVCGATMRSASRGSQGERKTVTVLFSDLTGFTELSERLDPEDAREVIREIFEEAAAVIARYEGRVEKFIGDAIMAIFGVPHAHEDDPLRAVRAAREMHEAVARLAPDIERRSGVRVSLHSGINTGVVVTGELLLDHGTAGPVGDTINVAARLMSAAEPGQVLLGPLTAAVLASSIRSEPFDVELRGKADTVRAARLVELRSSERILRPTRTSFVGRTAELEALAREMDAVCEGRSSSVAFCAEAGSGKTRLFEEFHRRLPTDVGWVEGRGYPYTQRIPYFPFLDALNRAFGIGEDDARVEVREKLLSGVGELLGPESDEVRCLGRLYDLDLGGPPIGPAEFTPRLTAAMRALLRAWSERRATVLCLQDLHWADASSGALARALLAEPGAPAMVLVNFRPGFELNGSPARRFDLTPLSGDHVAALADSLLDEAAPEGLAPFLEARSGGNPFFAEEIVRSLIETGILSRNGTWTLTAAPEAAGVPETIRGVLAARIDRLNEARRRVLREAAVIGREFLYDLVHRITEIDGPVGEALAGLESADLIREKGGEEYLEYIFKHALTQEVAYDGLLKSERRSLHQRVGEAIEEVLRHRLGEFVETLAYHFERAGDVDKAAHYAHQAGNRAFSRHALGDAEAYYRSAYGGLSSVQLLSPEQKRLLVAIVVDWAEVLAFDLKVKEGGRLLERHWDMARALDDRALTTQYRALMMLAPWADFDFDRAQEIGEDALRMAEETGDTRAESFVMAWACAIRCSEGELTAARQAGARSVELGLRSGHPTYMANLFVTGSTLIAGDYQATRELAEWMEARADAGETRYRPYGACTRAFLHCMLLDPEASLREAGRGLSMPHEAFEGSYMLGIRTTQLLMLERFEEARESALAHLEYHRERPLEYCESSARGQLGCAESAMGHPGRGFRAVMATVAQHEAARYRLLLPFFRLLLADSYAKMATGELVAPLSVIVRNIPFVLRHALPARRHARHHLDLARAQSAEYGMLGYAPLSAYAGARVALAEKRPDLARDQVAECKELLFAAGGTEVPPLVRTLEERL